MVIKLLTEHHFGVSKLKRRLQRLIRVYTCQNAKLLEISTTGSIHILSLHLMTKNISYFNVGNIKIAIFFQSSSASLKYEFQFLYLHSILIKFT